MAACLPNHRYKECIDNRSITKISGKTLASFHEQIQTHFHTYFLAMAESVWTYCFNIILQNQPAFST